MSFGKLGAMGRGMGHLGALGTVVPSWVLRSAGVPAVIDMDFAGSLYYGGTLSSLLAITRASSQTDLLPSSASGAAYNTFASNVLPITPGSGIAPWIGATNLFLNSSAPATQTITLSATGNYTLWVNGSGSAAIAAGTATITGAGTATNGSPVTINCTATGTVNVTVTGSLNACQLESGSAGTPFIVTAGASAARAANAITAAGALLAALTASQGGFVAAVNGLAATRTANATVIGTTANQPLLINVSTTGVAATYNGSSTLPVAGASDWQSGAIAAVGWSASGRSLKASGRSQVTDANAVGLTGTINIGRVSTVQYLNGYISRLTVFAQRNDAGLAALAP
jgi:hypothetical protein